MYQQVLLKLTDLYYVKKDWTFGQNFVAFSEYMNFNQSTTEMVMRKSVARRLIQDAKTAYTKPAIIKWSVWTALATCGNFQIGNYIQTLWHAIPSAQLLLVFTDKVHIF